MRVCQCGIGLQPLRHSNRMFDIIRFHARRIENSLQQTRGHNHHALSCGLKFVSEYQ